MENRKVRVRFAPSPTGPLHIGGVRTALYNYLFARHNGGEMILRIEDTDSRRFVPGAEDYINEALAWLGIKIDEGVREGGPHGPYRQSERRDIYRDTPEELQAAREATPNFQYDASTRGQMRNSLTMSAEEVERRIAEGEPYVVRFKIEPGREVAVDDLLRGRVTINSSVLDDKVLYKSADDLPTYHLANIVDDHLMEVSHVIRGEEWLPSAPLHFLLYEAFGWSDSRPEFVHLPLLLKPDRKGKLSKRDGDRLGFPVFPLDWRDPQSGDLTHGYREGGYLPEAVVNFLALLGWNPGDDTELMDMDELIKRFSIEHCSRSGAKFAYEKGRWFNHEYIQKLDPERLTDLFTDVLKNHGVDTGSFSRDYIGRAAAMVKDRVSFIEELWANARFFFEAPTEYEAKSVKKRWTPDMPRHMKDLIGQLRALPTLESKKAEEIILGWIKENGLHMGNVMNAWRLAVVGECKGPHMFDILELMGIDENVARIEAAIERIEPQQA